MEERGDLLQELTALARDKELSCSAALALANRLQVSPMTVGQAANQLGIKITACQLGCFGKRSR